MKKLIALFLCAALSLGVLAGCGSSSSSSQTQGSSETGYPEMEIIVSCGGTDQGVDTLMANRFGELVSEASGGKITVNVVPNVALAGGSMTKNAELLASGGSYSMAVLSGSALAAFGPDYQVHQIPFIFSDYETAESYLFGSGTEWYADLLVDKGITLMSGCHNGLRQLSTGSKGVYTPDDLKNMKIRVPNGDVYMKTMQAFGADAAAMPWTETFTALQQHALDGQENSYMTMQSNNIQEVQSFVTEWNWSYDAYWFSANKAWFDGLNAETQNLLLEKAEEAGHWACDYLVDGEAAIKKSFQDDYNVTIIELTDDQMQAFVDRAKPVQLQFIEQFGADACAAWGLVTE